MNWVRAAVILLVIAVALPVTESAGSQDSPAVAAARKLFGDYKVIPGERVGNVSLGEATQEDFRQKYGLTSTYGFRPSPEVIWHWPERNFGRAPGGYGDQPFSYAFCQSNSRLFATAVFNAGSWYPDHQLFWLFMQRLTTPEGAEGRSAITRWQGFYGRPAAVRPEMSLLSGNLWLFHNGLFLDVTENLNLRPTQIGVYNLDICRGGTIRGKYVPFFRHVEVNKFFLSKRGDPDKNEIGPPVTEAKFRLRERVYVAIELSLPAWDTDQPVRFLRAFRSPDGSNAPAFLDRVIKAGETSITIVFHLGLVFPRTTGTWKVEFQGANQTILATIDFEMTE